MIFTPFWNVGLFLTDEEIQQFTLLEIESVLPNNRKI